MSVREGFSESASSEVAYLENAIKELELGNDEQIGSCLRDIFQNHDSQLFLRLLNERIAVHDTDIEKVCHFHFEGFMDSFQKLMEAKEEAAQYKSKIISENAKLIERCQDYLAKTEELVQTQKLRNNISETLNVLQSSMPVFEAYRRLKSQVTSSRSDYYNALKILDDLQEMMPNITEFKWSQSIVNKIGFFRESLKKRCLDEIKNFLEQVATRAYKIGFVAILKSAVMSNAGPNVVSCLLECDQAGEMRQLPSDFSELSSYLDDLAVEDLIDFLPVHRGIHVYQKLQSLTELSNYYQRDKRKQLFVIMDTASSSSVSQAFWLPKFLFKTLGFFVVEDHLLNTSEGLIDTRFYNELRDKAVQKLLAVCRNATNNCTDSEQMLNTKVLLSVFASSIQDYGFTASPFNDILFDMQSQYIEILLNSSAEQFHALMDEGNYTPIVVENQAELSSLMEQYPALMSDVKIEKMDFPVSLSFSPLVPKLHDEICDFAKKLVDFYKNLNDRELLVMVRQPMERLLSEKLLSCFTSLINDKTRTLTQLIQLCINAHYLTDHVDNLDKEISNIFGLDFMESNPSLFSVFAQFRDKTQERIVILLKSSVDQFLELSCYDWTALESNGTASSYIIDLLRFLRTTFGSFKNLPPSLFQPTLSSTCAHVARSLIQNLYNPEVKAISYQALEQLELDLIQCEQFVVEMCVTNSDVDKTMAAFVKLRQLLDLILTKDWPAYFLDYTQKENGRYSCVSAKLALVVVEKLKEGCKRTKGLLSNFRSKQGEKDEKRLLTTVSEELQKLIDDEN